ncbi:RHS repeat-associated core domain-containing protein [Caballeronia sp. SL2Y3]|uniref:RHS repeat-associated core domain-containing protein n=1 Tax=Caballeronia sp. SL2Y3 TaxID=2878151 RepID=UPI001FD17156|nr:RHS repeat-associated core domain-containing protein [Caballeronia sp. SL2Y3]
MALLAVNHLTPVIGIDVHLIQTVAGPILPLPHPHVGLVLDPMEYLSCLPEGVGSMVSIGMMAMGAASIVKMGMRSIGAAAVGIASMGVMMAAGGGGGPIFVNGLMRTTAGTQTIHAPGLHFPIGGTFTADDAPKPSSNSESFLGSLTVRANGDPMSYALLPALSCWFAGMLSLSYNAKHSKRETPSLPTSVMLPIPASRPVLVGGPPVPSIAALAGMAMQAAHAHAMKQEPKFCGVSRAIQDRLGDGLWGRFIKGLVKRVFGEPVDSVTGEVIVEQHDFTVTGRLPLVWNRYYASHDLLPGAAGRGWRTPADIRLDLFEHDDEIGAILSLPGKLVAFEQIPIDDGWSARIIEGVGGHALYRDGERFIVRTREALEYRFPMHDGWRDDALTAAPNRPLSLWPEQLNDLNGNAWRVRWRTGRDAPQQPLLRLIEYAGDVPTGRSVQCAQGSLPGQLGEITLHDANGERHALVRYVQDRAGDLVAVHDALDMPYRFEYGGDHLMVRHTDRNGLSFYYSHRHHDDGLWRVDHAWGDGGLYDYRFEYDLTHLETHITDSLGGVTLLQADARGLPIMLTDPMGGVSSYQYDGLGRATSMVDPAGNRTTWEYDAFGNVLTHTLPDRSQICTEYDETLKPVAITDPEGGVWKQTWNTRGRLVDQTTPAGIKTAYHYDAAGHLIRVVDPTGQATTIAYDPLGYVAEIIDAAGRSMRLSHDTRGNLLRREAPGEDVTTYRWDAKNRLIACELPGSRLVRCEYDAQDNLIRYIDEAGQRTTFSYFGQGKLRTRTAPDGSVTRYHYDTEEQLIGVSNPLGQQWQLKRDGNGRLIEEVDYWGQARQYSYDPAGHLTRTIDPLGQALAIQCDALGRVVKRSAQPTEEERYAYNRKGQLTEASNAHGTVMRAYDADGRLTRETQQQASFDGAIDYAYDEAGRLVTQQRRMRSQAGSSFEQTLTYGYDALGHPQTLQIDDQAPIRFTRDIAGRLSRVSFSAELDHVLEYDRAGRLARHTTMQAARAVDHVAYRYDALGNLTQRDDSRLGVDSYRYDPLGRIVAHTDPAQTLRYFVYDKQGDRFSSEYADGNRRHVQHHDGARWWLDAAGQLVERHDRRSGVQCFKWDAFGRLAEFENTHNERWAYRYDALGRRIGKVALGGPYSAAPDETHTRFLWDGDAMAGDMRDTPARQQGRFYAYHLNSFEPLVMQLSSTDEAAGAIAVRTFYYQNDANGAPVRLRSGDGKIAWEAHYGVTGGVDYAETETIDQPIRLQGQYFDAESGLHYNRHRYFDPNTGRFISQDPIGLRGGTNPYEFALNALGWIDPLGLAPKAPLSLPDGHRGRIDRFNTGGQSSFEIHVYDASGRELGVYGPNGFFNKHGTTGQEVRVPENVANALNGIAIDELRKIGALPPIGAPGSREAAKEHTADVRRSGCFGLG